MDYGPAPEANDIVLAWLKEHAAGFGHFIDGKFAKPAEGGYFDVFDPARDRTARQSRARQREGCRPRRRTRRAGLSRRWSALPGDARARYLYAIARHIQKRERFLSVLESMDNGKPIRETRDIDMPLVARHFYHHAGWAELLDERVPRLRPGRRLRADHPVELPASDARLEDRAGARRRQHGGAEAGRVHAAHRARLRRDLRARSACRPAWSTSSPATAKPAPPLVEHADVDKIAFTGSTEVGRIIREATAGSGKKLSLELGGKSPFIVFEDADLDGAVEGVVDAIWFNQGQVCCAGSRLLVQEGIAERMYGKLRARMETLRVGDPLDKSIDMGAIVAPVQLDRIKSLVEKGSGEGAKLLAGRRRRCRPRAASIPPTSSPRSSRRRPSPRWRFSGRSSSP